MKHVTKGEELYITQQTILDKPVKVIAEEIGKHPATIARILSKSDIKAQVEHYRNKIAQEAYGHSAENVIQVVQDYKKPAKSKDAMMRREHGFKSSLRILESMGILESRSQPAFVQQIFNTQVNNLVSPVVDRLLEQSIAGQGEATGSSESEEE